MTEPLRQSRRRSLSRASLMVAAAMLGLAVSTAPKAKAANLYFDSDLSGTNGLTEAGGTFTWNSGTVTFYPGGAAPQTDVASTNADIVQFGNGATLGSGATINVGTQTIGGLIIGATTTNGYTFTNGSASVLTLGSSGITVNAGAVATTIGSANLTFVLGAAQTWNNAGSTLLTIAGGINNGANLLTTGGFGTGGTAITGVIGTGGTVSGGLTTFGTQTVTLSKANLYTGTTTVGTGGTLKLDFSATGAPTANIIKTGNAIVLGGGTLTLTGASTAVANSQTFSSVTLNSGANVITETIGTATSLTAALGAITRNAGATLNFSVGPTASVIATTSSTNDASGILGAWATIGSGGTMTYATVSSGTIGSYTGATAATSNLANVTSATTNYSFAAGATLAGSATANTLQLTTAGAGITLALGSNTLTLNGLLNTSGQGVTISGTGSIPIGANGELVISGSNSVTISSAITGSTRGLTYNGALTLTLNTTVSTYTGTTTVNSGTMTLALANVLNSSSKIVVNGGILGQSTFAQSVNSVKLVNGSITGTSGLLTSATAFDLQNGTISAPLAGTLGADKTTLGTITIGGSSTASTLTGGFRIKNGTVIAQSASALGASGSAVTLGDSAGGSASLLIGTTAINVPNNITLGTGSVGTLTIGNTGTTIAATFSGTVALAGNNLTLSNSGSTGSTTLSGIISGVGILTFSNTATYQASSSALTAGLIVLSAANTYTSATNITSGPTALSGSGSLAGTAVTVFSGASLIAVGTNTIGSAGSPTVTIAGGTGTTGGTLSLVGGGANTLTINSASAGATVLTLGGSASNAANLNMDISGATADTITLGSGLVTSIGAGGVTLNLFPAGSLSTGTRTLLTSLGGGLTAGGSQFTLGSSWGGATLNLSSTTSTALILNVTAVNATPATAYFKGGIDYNWNSFSGGSANNSNWATTSAGTTDTNQMPGSTTDVYFYTTNATAGNLVTSLNGASPTIKSLTLSGGVANSAVGIAPGFGGVLTIAPASSGNGITINRGAGALTINAPVTLGASQTWTNNSGNLFTASGDISGTANLTFAGNSNITASGTVNNTGVITVSNTGGVVTLGSTGLTIGTATTSWVKNGANSTLLISASTAGSGTLTINGGIVTIGTPQGKWASGVATVNAGGTLRTTGSGGDAFATSTVVTIAAGGVLDWQQTGTAETMGTINLNGAGIGGTGAMVNNGAAAGPVITAGVGGIVLQSDTTIGAAASAASVRMLTAITGGGFTLTKVGLGALTSTNSTSASLPFGNGNIVLKEGTLSLAPATAGSYAFTGVNALAGSTFTYSGGGTLGLTRTTTAGNALTFTIGNASATANAVLVRSNRGTLVIAPTAIANLGLTASGENFIITNQTTASNKNGASNATGIFDASVVGSVSNVGTFLSYGTGTNGLAAGIATATYTTAATGTPAANSIQDLTTATAAATFTNGNPYAIRVGPTATLTISGTTTVNGVAAGTNSSGLGGIILNAGTTVTTNDALITGGILDFSASEGVIFVASTSAGVGKIASQINGSAGITKFGPGTLVLSSTSSTFTGGVNINQGTLSVAADTNLGAAANGITFNGAAGLSFSADLAIFNRTITLNNNAPATITQITGATNTITGKVTGSGGLTVMGTTTAGTLNLTATNSDFTGAIRVTNSTAAIGGTLSVNSLADSSSAGAGTITLGNTTASTTFTYGTGAIAPLTLTNRQIELAGTTGGAQILSSSSTSNAPITINSDLLVTGAGAKTLTLGGVNNGTFAGRIGNDPTMLAVSVTKVSVGNWTLSSAENTFQGTIASSGTTTSGGTLSYASAGGNNPITVSQTTSTYNLRYIGAGQVMTGAITASALTTGTLTFESSGAGAINYSNTASIGTSTNAGARKLVLLGTNTGDNTFAGIIANNTGTGGTATLTKSDVGTWVLTNNHTYTGATSVNAGTLKLDFANTPTKTNILSSSNPVTLGGGTLSILGASAASAQTFASTTLTANTMSTLALTAGVGGLTVNLGAITRAASSGLNISLTSSPTLSYSVGSTGWASTNGLNVSTASGAAFMTLNGTDWANGVTTPVASTYTADTFTTSTSNINVTTAGAWAGTSLNTLRFNTAGAVTLTITNANTLGAGGILVGSGAGAVNFGGTSSTGTVSGTAFTTASGELNIFNYSASAATINAAIVNNASSNSYLAASPVGVTLNIFGTGTTILNSTKNAYTGGTNISGSATLQLGQNNAIPGFLTNTVATDSTVNISGGATLDLNGQTQIINGLAGAGFVNNSSGSAATLTFGYANAATTFSGAFQSTGGGAVNLVKTGTGTVTLANQSSFTTGSLSVNQGTLNLGFTSTPLSVVTNILPAATTLTLGGTGTLTITGNTGATGQTFASTTLNGGGASVTISGTTPAVTINLGSITRTTSATSKPSLNITLISPGVVNTTSTNNSAGILGGYVTVGAADWGTVNASTNIVALGTYTTLPAAGVLSDPNGNYLLTAGQTQAASSTINSLKITGTTTLNTGTFGITFSGANGGLLTTGTTILSGTGTISGGSGNELFIYNAGALTSSSATLGAGAGSLVKSGAGTLTLSTAGSYGGTGSIIVNGGTLSMDAAARYGSATGLTLDGGTLNWTPNANMGLAVTVGLGGATFVPSGGGSNTIGATGNMGTVGSGSRTIYLSTATDSRRYDYAFNIIDAGGPTNVVVSVASDIRIQRLSGTNTYTGTTYISRGILALNNTAAIGGGLTSSATVGNIIFGGTGTNRAILEINATSGTVTRTLGYGPGQIHWEGNGGFSNGSTATQVVNLGNASAVLTWGAGGFVPTNSLLQFGQNAGNTLYSGGVIDFQNPINLGAAARSIESTRATSVQTTAAEGYLSGALTGSAGAGVVKVGNGNIIMAGSASALDATATINVTLGALVFGSAGATPAGAITLEASYAGSIGRLGDTNPISTFGSRITNALTATSAFLLGADSSVDLNFTSYPLMRLGAFNYSGGSSVTAPTLATHYTGTITPGSSTYYRFGGASVGATATLGAVSTLVLSVKNQLTGTNLVDISMGATTITGSNNISGATTFDNRNAGMPTVFGVGSNTVLGTSAITIKGTSGNVDFAAVNGDHTFSNNITFDSASTLTLIFADGANDGALNNTSQGALSILGTVNLGGSLATKTIHSRTTHAGIFQGDITGGINGLTLNASTTGALSLLSTATFGGTGSSGAGSYKGFSGTITLGDNSVVAFDSDYSFGGAGTGTITPGSSTLQLMPGVSSLTLPTTRSIASTAAKTPVFSVPSGSTLTVQGILSNATTAGWNKTGPGILVLTNLGNSAAVTTSTGNALTVTDGTLRLDYANATGTGSTIFSGSVAPTLALGAASGTQSAGATLNVTATSSTTTAQTFGALTINPRANTISLNNANATVGNSLTLTLGAFTRTAGGTLDFQSTTAGGTNTFTTSQTNNAGVAIIGGYATFGGLDWATVSGGNIIANTTYTASLPASGSVSTTNYLVTNTSPTITASESIGSLKFAPTSTQTITVNTSQTVTNTSTGILFDNTSLAGGTASITGAGQWGATGSEVIVITNGSATAGIGTGVNALTLSGVIKGASTAITKSGSGTLVLAGANTYTGSLIINQGTVEFSNGSAGSLSLGNPTAAATNILLNGGTLRATATNNLIFGATINAPSTIDIQSGLTLTQTAQGFNGITPSTATAGAIGLLTKTGTGTLVFSGSTTNTALSMVVQAGTVSLAKTSSGTVNSIAGTASAALIVTSGGTAKLGGSGGDQITNQSSVLVTGTGVFDLNALSETIDGLSGNGSVTNTTTGTSVLTVGGGNSAGISAYTVPAANAANTSGLTSILSAGLNNFSGVISDGASGKTVAFTKLGSGTQILSGLNTYTGATTISAGTLQLGVANALPGVSTVTIVGDTTAVGAAIGGSALIRAPGTLDMGGFDQAISALASTTGGFVTNNPTLAYSVSAWTVAAGRQGTKTLTLGNSIPSDASFNGVIVDGFSVQPGVTATGFVGAISLIKAGTNTQTLSGQNTYSGTTAIQSGTIIAAGGTNRLPSTTAVTLGNGAASGLLQLGDGTSAISQTIAGLATSGSGGANAVVGGNASNSTLILNQTGTSTYTGKLGGVGTNQNKLNFTLQGGGTLTLNGTNTLAGTTTVQGASTLILDSNLTNSAVTVGGASAGTLVSNQTITGLLTVSSGGVVAPGDVLATEIGTLTLGGGLTLNSGGTLAMQIGSSATLTTPLVKDLITISGGALTLNAGGLISLSELTPAASVGALLSFAPGNYQLINYAAATNFATIAAYSNATLNGLLSLTSSVIGSNNYYVTLVNNAAGFIELNVDNARFWSGATNGKWNTAVANWSPVNPTLYLNTDKVLFQDTYPLIASNGNVVNSNIDVTTSVTPAALTFNNTAVNYTLSGAGGIGGSTGLTKSGTGTLTITNTNTFTGNTVISGGYIEMQNAAALGTTAGSISVASGAALRLSGVISVGAKAISLIGDGISSTGAMRSISGNNSFAGAITLAGNTRINSDADTLTLSGAVNNGSNSLTFGGAGNVTVSGIIGSGSGSLIVDGTGVVTLSNAANTFTGQTFIKNGTLSVSNIGSVSVAGGLGTPTTTGDGTIAIGDVANTGTLKWTRSSNESTDRVIDLAGTTGGATIDASGSGVLTLSSAITATVAGAKSLTLTGTGGTAGTPNVISSGISDGPSAVISLIKTGTGVWKLDAASSYTGTTTIQNGTLLLGSFSQNFSALTLGGLSGGAATLALGSSGTAILTGNLTFSAANNPSGATISGSGASTLDLNAATRTFVVGSSSSANGADLTISAVIADTLTGGALTKTGNGTLVLTGANTYVGTTSVHGGTLSVSPQAISSSLTINVGTNSTAGALNFYADGAVGDVNLASEANLNIGGASAAGGLGFNLSGSNADKITLAGAGALTVGATGGLINARALASLTPGSFTLIDATNNSNTATITGFTLGVLTGGYSYALDNTTGGQLKLTVAAAAAGPYYWTGARSTASWAILESAGTTTNWATVSAAGTDAGATPGNIDVIFTLGTAVSTTLDQPYAISGLTFAGSSAGNGNVTINAGSGDGVLTLGANGVTVSTGASSSATTIGANVVLSSAQSWSVADSGQTLTVSGIISGNGNLLTKSGSGALVLTGANTFNGGVTANAGTVKVNNANSLGAGGLTLNNATLQATAGFTDSRNVTLGHANSVISVDASQTLTFANAAGTKLTGSGVLNASGAGKLVLDDRLNANDFVGGAILSGGGTVQVYGLGSLGSGNITLNAATLQVSGTFIDARQLTVGNAASAISVDSGQTLTVSGKITGTGNLNASGAGVLVLNDSGSANDFIGNSVLSGGGTVQVASLTALGTGSVTINAATLQATTSLSYSGKNFILGNAASALTVASADTFTITNSGSTLVSGSGKLNANVAGILVLNDTLNPNTFSGGSVLFGGGTVKINTNTSLGDQTTGTAALKDITLQATADINTSRNFTLGSYASTIAVDITKTFILSGNIVDGTQAGALTKTGNGVLELSGTGNTFTGGTTVTAGTLKVSNASGSATGTGAVTVSGSNTTLSGAGTITGTATIASGSILSPGGTGTAGTLTLGGLTLASGSSLSYQLGANTAASDKTIVTGSSLFTANGGAITLTGLSGLTSTTYNLITYSGTLSGTGFGALSLASNYVSGGGNTFYAALVNNTGSVDLTTTDSLTWNGNIAGTIWESGATANTNFKSGATTNLNFFDTMIVNFDDTAVGTTVNIVAAGVAPSAINVSATGGITFAGSASTGINGATGITKTGSGTLTISNVNTFSGTTAIGGTGAIKIQNAGALGSGSITIANGASLLLDVGGTSLSSRLTAATGTGFDGNGFLQNLSGTNTLSTNFTTGMLTTASRISVSGGTLNLDGTFASTNIALTLAASGTGTLSLGGVSIALGTATLTITNTSSTTVTVANTVGGGTGGVSINGTGATTLNGALTTTSVGNGLAISSSGTNIINGNVTVTGAAGGISVGGSATTTFGSSSVTSWNATGTAAISSSGDTTFNGTISGTGALTKTGAGTLTFAAPNANFSGAVTLSAQGSGANAGLIVASASNALGTGAVGLTFNTTGGSPTKVQLQLSGGITLGNAFTTTGAGSNGTSSGLIRTLTGANTLTGGLTMQSGGGSTTLRADTGSSLVLNGAVTANATGRYLTLVGGGDFTFGSAGSINNTSTTGTVGFWSQNSGSTTISSAANTYTLGTEIGNGNILTVAALADGGSNSSIGSAAVTATNLVLDNGTLRFAGSTAQSSNRLFSVGAGGATLDASGTGSGTMSFTGTGSLGFIGITPEGGSASTSTAARTLTLTGTNTGNNTFTPVISDNTGATSLTKSGAGTWVLNGSNTFTGGTTLTLGALRAGNAAAFGSGALNLNGGSLTSDGATARAFANNVTVGGNITLGATTTNTGVLTFNGTVGLGAAVRTLTVNSAVTFAGIVSDGGLTKAGNGVLTLSGDNSFTGATSITGGTLATSGDARLASTSGVTVGSTTTLSLGGNETINTLANSGTVTIASGKTLTTGSSDYSLAGIVNGAGALTKAGAGTLTLSSGGTFSFAGLTTVSNGTLAYGASDQLGNTNAITVNGGTLDLAGFSDTVGAVTLSSGSITSTSGVLTATSVTSDTDTTATLSAKLGGATTLAMTSSGVLTLSGDNSFTGGTTISAGTVRAGHANAFGSLATDLLALNGGTLTSDGATARAFANNVTVGGNISLGATTTNTGVLTFNGTVGLGAATRTLTVDSDVTFAGIVSDGGLTKAGNGVLTLSGNNSFSGGTSITGGTLATSGDARLATTSGVTVDSTTTLSLGGNETINSLTNSGTVTIASGKTLTTGSSSYSLAGIVTGDGSLTKAGAGTLTLSSGGTFSFAGLTTVTGGTLAYGASDQLANAITVNGGTLDLAGFSDTVGAVTLSSGSITSASGVLTSSGITVDTTTAATLSAKLGGATTLAMTGAGVLTLSGDNTFSGGTTVSAGTVRAGHANAFGSLATDLLALNGGTLTSDGATARAFANNVTVGGNISLGATTTNTGVLTFNGTVGLGAATRTLTVDSDVTFAGIVSDGGLTKAGNGVLTLSGNNSFSSGTTISAGTVRAGNNNAFGSLATDALALNSGTLTSDGGTARTFANNVTVGGNISLGATTTNTGVLTFNGTVGLGAATRTLTVDSDVTFAGIVSDGGLTKAGTGALTLSGNNSFSGGTTISAGTVRAGHANAFGSLATDALALNGGTLTSDGATARAFANNVTVGGNVTLGAATTYTGTLTFAGSVGLGSTAARTITANSNVTFTGGVTSTDQNLTIGGAGDVTISTLALNLGTGTLTMNGTGTLLLSLANTFAGATINSGTIRIGNAGSLGAGTVTLVSGATLDLNNITIGNTIVLAAGATLTGGSISVGASTPTTGTLDVELTGSAPLAKTDSGRLELTGANTFTGATSVSNGTIAVASFGDGGGASPLGVTALTDPDKLVIGGGATLEFTGDTNVSTARSFTIAGSGAIAATGDGALNFNSSSKIKLTGATPALTLSATSTTAVNRFESLLDGTDDISTLSIDGVGIWVIGGSANRFKGTATFNIAAGVGINQGATLGFDSGSLGSSTDSLINVGNNSVLRWSAGNDDDISGRLRIGTGDTAKLDIGANDVVFASAPKNAAGAAITSGTIEKKGAGTLQVTFSSPNLAFNVPTGKLSVNGTVGAVNLTSSGTILGGDGTVGAVTMVNGAEISPGNSPGTLNMASLTVAASNIINWQVQDALDFTGPQLGFDTIHITGNLNLNAIDSGSKRIVIKVASLLGNGNGTTLGAPLNFNNADTPDMMPRTFDFMRVDGAITYNSTTGSNITDYFTFNLDDFQYTNGGSNNYGLWSVSSYDSGGDTYIRITAVPEPSTYGFGLGALALAAAAIRRRRKNQATKGEASVS